MHGAKLNSWSKIYIRNHMNEIVHAYNITSQTKDDLYVNK